MKKRTMLALLCFVANVWAQENSEVKISARFAEETLPLNREGLFVVEASWQGAPGSITFTPLETPRVTNLKIVATASANRVSTDNGQKTTIRRYEFTVRGEALGMAYADEVVLRYRDESGDEFALQTPRVQMQISDPVSDSGAGTSTIIGVALILVAAGVAGFLFVRRKRLEKKKNDEATKVDERSLEDKTLDRLKSEVNLHAAETGAQFANLAAVVKSYLKAAFGLDAGATTTENLVQTLQNQGVEMEEVAKVQEVLQACDQVRFSGGAGDPNKLLRSYTLFEEFIAQRANALK